MKKCTFHEKAFQVICFVVVCAFVSNQNLDATAIAVVQTKSEIWLAADSSRITDDGNGSVCKIHIAPFGIVAKAGLAEAKDRNGASYSTDLELRSLVASSETPQDFRLRVSQKLVADMWEKLANETHNPTADANALASNYYKSSIPSEEIENDVRIVALISLDKQKFVVTQLLVGVNSQWELLGFRYSVVTPVNWLLGRVHTI